MPRLRYNWNHQKWLGQTLGFNLSTSPVTLLTKGKLNTYLLFTSESVPPQRSSHLLLLLLLGITLHHVLQSGLLQIKIIFQVLHALCVRL